MWWWSLLFVFCICVVIYTQLIAEERDHSLKRRPKLPKEVKSVEDLNLKLPDDFLWGCATAAHQVEGNNLNNNWYEWERATRTDGKPACKDVSGDACDHWNLFDRDVELLTDLGLNVYRFSIEWSRIEPEEGKYDRSAVARYHHWCKLLRSKGIEPMITLHHFSEPLWLYREGSFEKERSIECFARFAEFVATEFKDVCRMWCTVNEPVVYVAGGWIDGQFPPGKKDMKLAMTVLRNLILAHARAYHAIKKVDPTAKVGLAKHIVLFEAKRWWSLVDLILYRAIDNTFNWAVLHACTTGKLHLGFNLPFAPRVREDHPMLANTLDFIGINHYYRLKVGFKIGAPLCISMETEPGCEKTDFGWDMTPTSTFGVFAEVAARFKQPLMITEHGTSDGLEDDRRRRDMLLGGLWGLQRAVDHKINVIGYIHWTLMDNFEWNSGYTQHFGLYNVDRKTQERKLTRGGAMFRDIISRWRSAQLACAH